MVDGALKCFADKGYFGTRVEDIAAESEFSRSAIYLHFPDGKEGLYAASLSRAVSARHDMVAQTVRSSAGAPIEARLRDLWDSFWRFRHDHPEYLKVLSLVSFDDIRALINGDRMAEITQEGVESFRLIGEALVPRRRGVKDRDRVRVGWILWAYFLGLSGFLDSLTHVGHEQDTSEMAEHGLAIVLHGLSGGAMATDG
jgi:AcrR family transcriptional regulator